ncbi:MAG: ATP-binding protein [Spirochaetes bacterium]|nr:MAG: ATP-binding protein [Spirochaetota bacterium]
MRDRYLHRHIAEDLKEKMVFIGGPRQVGKTTLAEKIIGKTCKSAYFNWDNRADRKRIMASEWPGDAELVILDEIHKYSKWKNLVKGEYDKLKDTYKFLVTGSARLDLYRRGGDSLQGRYHYYRLHPFTLPELHETLNTFEPFAALTVPESKSGAELAALETFGGFPEPLLKGNMRTLRRWHNEKIERLFREDVQDLMLVRDIGSMKLLCDSIPARIGSLLSINSLREDLGVSHRAVSHWIDVLESFYYAFRVYPYAGNNIRSLKKGPKLYLWDWSEVIEPGARFENLVASHLLKLVHFLYDAEGYKCNLHFLRDREKREVDFLVTVNDRPWFAVEAKSSDDSLAPSLSHFKDKLKIPFVYQVVRKDGVDWLKDGIRIISADKFLESLV